MKKLISILSAFALLLFAIPFVAAEQNVKCSLDCIRGTVIMKGSIEVPDLDYPSAITVKVVDSLGNLNYYDVIYTDDDGKAEFLYKNNASSGKYTCYFSINATKETVSATYEEFKDNDFQSVFVSKADSMARAGDYEQLGTLILDNDYWIKTDKNIFNTLKDRSSVYKLMISDYSRYSEVMDVINAFERCCYLEKINETWDAGIRMLYEDDKVNRLFDFNEKMPSNGTQNAFDALSDSTKNSIYSALRNTYTNSNELINNFVRQTLLISINKAANYNEVKIVLNAYKSAGKINYANELSTENYKSLIGKAFTSYDEVSKAVSALKSSSAPTGGGSSGGGGSSYGKSPLEVGVWGNSTAVPNTVESDNENVIDGIQYVNKYFDDIEDSKWALEAVNALYEKGIVNGSSDRIFEPNRCVTRAEMAKMIVLLAGMNTENTAKFDFTDTENGAWYVPYVEAVCEKGYFEGYGDGSFGVNDLITREQAAAVVYRLLYDERVKLQESEFTFTDDETISDWAGKAVYSLYGAGVITGRSSNMFYPTENMTRAESAVLIYKALQKLE